MSVHVFPEGESRRHEQSLDCPCGPYEQLAVDVAAGADSAMWGIVHRDLDRIVQGEVVAEGSEAG